MAELRERLMRTQETRSPSRAPRSPSRRNMSPISVEFSDEHWQPPVARSSSPRASTQASLGSRPEASLPAQRSGERAVQSTQSSGGGAEDSRSHPPLLGSSRQSAEGWRPSTFGGRAVLNPRPDSEADLRRRGATAGGSWPRSPPPSVPPPAVPATQPRSASVPNQKADKGSSKGRSSGSWPRQETSSQEDRRQCRPHRLGRRQSVSRIRSRLFLRG